jgi:anthranilate/para-aminobenzoate synthase component II
MPSGLHANARNREGLVMAMVHDTFPVAGVQFHLNPSLRPMAGKLLQGG